MGKRWTLEDMYKKGLDVDIVGGKAKPKEKKVKKEKFVPVFQGLKTEITIPYCLPGLNGSDGLMRAHWSETKKAKDKLVNIISAQAKNAHLGHVTIEYKRYAHRLMDWDNHCSSFKHVGDSLKKCGIIIDDNPKIVVNFIPKQEQIKMTEKEYSTITIYDI